MTEKTNKVKITQFIPFFIMLIAAGITAVIYFLRNGEPVPALYFLAALATSLAPLLFPLYYLLTGKKIPLAICVTVCVHLACAAHLGTVLKFYDTFKWWDLLCHGYFGFNAALIVFWFMADSGKIRLNPVWLVFLALSVALALGALWEIVEYITDRLFDGDAQRVQESLALGKSPMKDTMEDLMITVAGVAVFAALVLADFLSKGKLFSRLGLSAEKVAAQTEDFAFEHEKGESEPCEKNSFAPPREPPLQ